MVAHTASSKEPRCFGSVMHEFLDRSAYPVRRSDSEQPLLTSIICTRCLKFFGRIVGASLSVRHNRACPACLNASLTTDWNSPPDGRRRHTWLQTVKSDLAPLNIGLTTAYRRAPNRQLAVVHTHTHTHTHTR